MSGSTRGTTPVVAVVLLAFLAVMMAGVVGTATLTMAAAEGEATYASVDLAVDAETDRIALTHRSGDPLDASALRVVVTVEGERLRHQPPVPFFAARGFESGPTGPFNVAAADRWRVGETATVTLASTNSPSIEAGDRVEVALYREGRTVARATTRAE